MINLRKKFFIQ